MFDSPSKQKAFEASYAQYILHFAELADSLEIPLFCIGTELCQSVKSSPAFWKQLIADVRHRCKSKLVYAANWDCYQDIPFWKDLDYIGIDAYFPIELVPIASPQGGVWDKWKRGMQALSDSVNRAVIFTEYGYRSIEGAAREPWVSGTGLDGKVSEKEQFRAYDRLYEEIWEENWFAGGYLWKWHCPKQLDSSRRTKDYSPQGKAVIERIKSRYGAQSLKKVE